MSDQDWYRFASGLAALLIYSPDETVVILDIDGDKNFMQFFKHADGVHAEVSDDLGEGQRRRLSDNGWSAPDSEHPLWYYGIGGHGAAAPNADDCREITLAAIEVLREVLAVPSPGDLYPSGWVDGPGEVFLDELRPQLSEPAAGELRALLSIANLLVPHHPWPVATVRASLEGPVHAHRTESWRGLLAALGESFFGGLGVISQFDRGQPVDEMRDGLRHLPSHPADMSWDWYPNFAADTADWPADDRSASFLREAAAHADPTGSVLVSLQTDGDDYALTFLPTDHLPRLRAFTAEIGKRVETLPYAEQPSS
ncbi:hypothetical protein GPX89_27260 [Nocardia sp. ET3-3]|uniref:DUF4303 domain-containing protein n=1 Tax=Nocardia terrae TaxID=2675851 RepID=A0A7K1V2U6_9NOCA|nr:hypothetical protein [Nocardia terrae]MVU80935.1 hypothetical protein [Nocardia terrae]